MFSTTFEALLAVRSLIPSRAIAAGALCLITVALMATTIQAADAIQAAEPKASSTAAGNYLLAALELHGPVPEYVANATTDDPDAGFAKRLSREQASYLDRSEVASALDRFDEATSFRECVWPRFIGANWSSAGLNDHLHGLARAALLRARLQYESGRWIDGNQSVERVRIMARHMALQARPYEHQCFMIENMANGTAAAYVLRLPRAAIADMLARHRRIGPFSPKRSMLLAEANRMSGLAHDLENGRVSLEKVLEFIDPYLASAEVERRRIRGMSCHDAADELRCLASFLREQSELMEIALQDAAQQVAELYQRHVAACRSLVESDDPLHDYRENAQSVCRSIMMEEVLERLHRGVHEFSGITDPYGPMPFEVREHEYGFTLVSDLRHPGQVDWRFGLAGPIEGAQAQDGEPSDGEGSR